MGDIKSFHLGSKIPVAFQSTKTLHPSLCTIENRDPSQTWKQSNDPAQPQLVTRGPDESRGRILGLCSPLKPGDPLDLKHLLTAHWQSP